MPLPENDAPDIVDLDTAIEAFKKQAPEGGIFVDLGCGQNRRDGFIGLDLYPQDDQTLEADLFSYYSGEAFAVADNLGILGEKIEIGKLADNSVSLVYSSHFLEHIPQKCWGPFWEELYRVCKPGAIHVHIFPFGNSVGTYQDPTHRQVLFPERFMYLDPEWREAVKMQHYLPDVNFKMKIAPWFYWHEDFAGLSEQSRAYHAKHTFNAISEAVIFLECIKKEEGEGNEP